MADRSIGKKSYSTRPPVLLDSQLSCRGGACSRLTCAAKKGVDNAVLRFGLWVLISLCLGLALLRRSLKTAIKGGGQECPPYKMLFGVFVFERAGHFVPKLTIVRVYRSPQSGFGGTAFGQEFKDAGDFAHAVGVPNVFCRRQRLCISRQGLGSRKIHETALQYIERDFTP